MRKTNVQILTGLILTLIVLITSACGAPSSASGPGATASAGGQATSAAAPAGTSAPSASGADTGKVFILGAFRGSEEAAFNQVIAAYKKQNPGVDVTYSGSADFETLISVRSDAGDPPDIAAFPQPGGVARFARQGKLLPLWASVLALYDKNYAPAWKELASVDGTPYGVFNRVNTKGLIWYNKPAWDKAGYQVPKTWDELMSLAQKMQATGTAPFCDGIQSAASTGWKGTDWIENIVLRTQPQDLYNKWAAGQVQFQSPEIKNAFSILEKIWMDPKMVYGGTQTIASTDVPTSAAWLFDNPPKCWMHFNGSFATNFFPDNVRKNLDQQAGVFLMPPIDSSKVPNPPLEVGGDEYVVFKSKDRPEVRKFMEFLATPEAAQAWATQGGALFPYKGQDMNWYPTKIEQNMAQQVINAPATSFDASDNMPSKENLAFWKGITDWVSGARTLDQALQDIDAGSK